VTETPPINNQIDQFKRLAGEAAVDRYVKDGTCIGLGTGSTAYWAIHRVGELVAAGWKLEAVATSKSTEALCAQWHIPLVGFLERELDVAIDGADEVAPDFALTKGGGGALFREKSVALAARTFVVIVDAGKLVPALGAFPTPIEVVPYARPWVEREIVSADSSVQIATRMSNGVEYRTDNGNLILDCRFGEILAPAMLDARLRSIHGVVATGIFADLTDHVIVADASGVRELTKRP
jgi:ribose 5-phosphate isomerase A